MMHNARLIPLTLAWLLIGVHGCCMCPPPNPQIRKYMLNADFRLELVNSGTTASLRGLSVVDDQVIWVGGTEGTVLRTTDGGLSWNVRKVSGPANLDIRDVHAFNADVAIAMATAGRLFRTTDGGATWQVVYAASDTSVFLDAVSFWDESHGIVLGDPMTEARVSVRDNASGMVPDDPMRKRFLILLTDDGGRTWRELPNSVAPHAEPGEAAFAASGTPLAVAGRNHAWFGSGAGTVSRLFRSADRGWTWEATSTPVEAGAASAGIFAVVFSDTLNGVIAGGDYRRPAAATLNLAFTRDGGRTFSSPTALPSQYVSSVAWANRLTLMAAGIAGIVYSPVDTFHWQVLDSGNWNTLAAGGAHVWAVGPDGKVGRISSQR